MTFPLKKLVQSLGLVPLGIFFLAFFLLPSGILLVGGFQNGSGEFTLSNFSKLFTPTILSAYSVTVELSALSALLGTLCGALLAYAIVLGNLPRWAHGFLTTFSGVASNFAGVPLAFAFIATLGRIGFLTVMAKTLFGIDLYEAGFSLYSFWGLSLTYLYFQVPLMILIITPSFEGLKPQWREAALSLGASRFQYWLHVGIPVLTPALLASFLFLFGNAFGAYATAYSLTGGILNLVPILIGAQIRGDVLHDPNLGYALALGMVLIMVVCILLYLWLAKMSLRRGTKIEN